MSKQSSSRPNFRGRRLQVESLEKRCMLSLTAYVDPGAGSVDEIAEAEVVSEYVSTDIPAGEKHAADCDCEVPSEGEVTEVAGEYEIRALMIETFMAVDEVGESADSASDAPVKKVDDEAVDEAITDFDVTTVDDEQLYYFGFPQVERTPEDDAAVDEIVEEPGVDSKPEADTTESEEPIIYTMGPVAETRDGGESAPVDDAGPVILHPAEEGTDREEPVPPEAEIETEDPVIYTLGSDDADGDTDTTGETPTPVVHTRPADKPHKKAHQHRDERHHARQRRDDGLVTLLNTRNSRAAQPDTSAQSHGNEWSMNDGESGPPSKSAAAAAKALKRKAR